LSESLDELSCISELVQQQLTLLRSRDTGGEDDFEIKQQINSLIFLENLITGRVSKLKEGHDATLVPADQQNELLMKNFSGKLIKLPFEVVIKNNVALSHFIEFMSSVGSQGYVFFYLNVEGFRVSAEQVVSTTDPIVTPDLEFLRPTAVNIYETYLSPDKYSSQKLELEDDIVKRIANRLKSDPIGEDLFDESFNQCFIIMRDRETFYPAFQKSIGYIRMLQDLDLFRESKSDGTSETTAADDTLASFPEYIEFDNLSISSGASVGHQSTKPWISIEIDSTGVVREFGTAHAVYAITVSVRKENGTIDRWCSLRRYSDFFTFHANTIDKFPILSRLQLPAKRTLSNNLSQEFLEQRKHLLNSYLQQVIRILINRKDLPGFKEHVLKFLEPGAYNEKEKATQMLGKAVDKLVFNPFKSMGEVVRAGSDNLRDKFVKLQGSLQQSMSSNPSSSSANNSRNNSLQLPGQSAAAGPPGYGPNDKNNHYLRHSVSTASLSSIGSQAVADSTKVAAGIDLESEDNIPLRIMLLLLDEVFDLKHKNQWLRRRIVAVIQQIINAFSGDLLSKKIIDYVQELTSSTATAGYIKILRQKLWPGGNPAPEAPARSESVKRVTAVIAKSYLISCLSDDLKHMIGSETTRRGLLRVFDMFQNTTLNRRLVIVLMEGLLLQLFPENYFEHIFQKLHSCSSRVDHSDSDFNASSSNGNFNSWPPYLSRFLSSSEPLKDTFKSPSSFYTPSNRSCSPVPSISSRGSTRGSPVHLNQSSRRK
jgi:sorting nexin-13